MKKDIFYGLSKQELIEAGTYFPCFVDLNAVKDKLDEGDLDLILEKKQEFNDLDKRKKLIELISKYFDLDKYGDLTSLTKVQWATQLKVRQKILEHLNQNNNSIPSDPLQFIIFELFQGPIVSADEFLSELSIKNINDLTLGELFLFSKFHQNNYDLIGPDLCDSNTSEAYDIANTMSNPIDTSNTLDNKFMVVATIDLSINDSQLENEFKEFIKLKREELKLNPSVSKFKEVTIKSLRIHSVLQYLDLLILTRYIDPEYKLTNEKYAKYLFPSTHPDYDRAVGKFNDSTLDFARQVINGKLIFDLLSSINKKQNPIPTPSFGTNIGKN